MEIVTFILIVLFVLAVAIPVVRWRQRAQDRRLAQAWRYLKQLADTRPDLTLVQVVENYQFARTGTKSDVRWLATGYIQDTWFRADRRALHEYLVIAPHSGWGPHNQNPNSLRGPRGHHRVGSGALTSSC